jgi:hypothetical protein
MGHSLDEAGSKSYIKPNANSIAGWRVKQVSCFFLFIITFVILTVYFVLQNYLSRRKTSTRNTFICPFKERCWCKVRFRVSATADVIQLEAQGEHTAESHVQDKVASSSLPRLSKWFRLIRWPALLQCAVGSSCFRIPYPRFLLPRHVLLLVRSVRRVRGHCCRFCRARTSKAVSPACPPR